MRLVKIDLGTAVFPPLCFVGLLLEIKVTIQSNNHHTSGRQSQVSLLFKEETNKFISQSF